MHKARLLRSHGTSYVHLVQKALDSMTAPEGECPAIPIVLPVSCLASAIGLNPHVDDDQALAMVMKRNERAFCGGDSHVRSHPTDLSSSVAAASDEMVDDIARSVGSTPCDLAVDGLVEQALIAQKRAAVTMTCVPDASDPEFATADFVFKLDDAKARQIARNMNLSGASVVPIGDLRPRLVRHIEDRRTEAVKTQQVLSLRDTRPQVTAAVKSAVSSLQRRGHTQSISDIADLLGTSHQAAVRHGAVTCLKRVVSERRAVPSGLPRAVECCAKSHMNCSHGQKAETSDLDRLERTIGTSVSGRNLEMRFARVYVSANIAVDLAGRIDGQAQDDTGRYVIETKRRIHKLLGIPVYERVQMEMYMRMWNCDRCLHVETFGETQQKTWVHRDNGFATELVTKLRAFARDTFLQRCEPKEDALCVASPVGFRPAMRAKDKIGCLPKTLAERCKTGEDKVPAHLEGIWVRRMPYAQLENSMADQGQA